MFGVNIVCNVDGKSEDRGNITSNASFCVFEYFLDIFGIFSKEILNSRNSVTAEKN